MKMDNAMAHMRKWSYTDEKQMIEKATVWK